MEFDLRFLDKVCMACMQHAIDGVNKAAMLHDPGAWNFVSAGHLIEANRERGTRPLDPIATTIFDEMEQDGHSGGTAGWVVMNLTQLAKGYKQWRNPFLVNGLIEMKNTLNIFLQEVYMDKFGNDEPEKDYFARRERALHELEYSFLARHVLDDDARRILQFLLKMEDVSHLGNEVLLDQIEDQLRIL
jgi:hypothetical protein